MIKTETIDLALIELLRTVRQLKRLRAIRQTPGKPWRHGDQSGVTPPLESKEHAAVKRASMDATRILADLRQGR